MIKKILDMVLVQFFQKSVFRCEQHRARPQRAQRAPEAAFPHSFAYIPMTK